ncbi:MAG TPA: NADH-quinone oxidoreductase subunit L [Parafilimonas sp.]|nr:NADH-quinone oxidoreductase subunit L [Parafilimonas sp.]
MNYGSYIEWIPLLPLLCFVLLGLFGRKYFKNFAGIIATIVLLAITVLSSITAYQYFFVDGKVNGVYQAIIPIQYHWLEFTFPPPGGDGGGLSIDMGIVLDPISVMMLFIVSFVSLMVHIFSLGYMKGEERFSTYYAFLSLFTFSMLGLVVSTNIFQIYIFWELVGISSYLLIGFYFDKPSAVAAAKKAFIVTRFADLGFLIGILMLAFHAETLDFHTLIERLTTTQSQQFISITTGSFLGISMLTWALTLVFVGGAGKSAMFPLHVWLPDAMEGPTPVSALIHAATMVVAGVYLVARLFPLYSSDIVVLNMVAYVGAISALLAAIIACTQTDIKRVLAYSTISQIGYMMFALGVSRHGGEEGLGYMSSMFHLFTHAFFKSLLFLCAGAVIHVVHSNEMKDMGGLRKLMPLTHITFLIACLAIAGIPPFSGFFSKEEILTAAYNSNKFIYGMGVFTSMLTAFYMFRLYFMIFHNKQPHMESHHGEGSLSMKFPLAVLAICTVVSGFVPFASFVTSDGVPFATHVDIVFSILPVTLSVAAILFAAKLYYRQNELPGKIASSLGTLYHAAYRKFYIDEVYLFVTQKIIFNLVGKLAAWIDKYVVDGFMNLLARITGKISALIKGLQSGKVQAYALYFFGGIAALAVLFIYLWK